MSDNNVSISKAALSRIPRYLNFLKALPQDGPTNIPSTMIAEQLGLNQVLVRKDIAIVGNGGKPKIGYNRADLIADIEHFLGYDHASDSVIIGAGNLGKALLAYGNFNKYGLNIIAAFDRSPSLIGLEIAGKPVYNIEKIEEHCRGLNVRIGIIAVPAAEAQLVCNQLIAGGIRAVWNFAPINLVVPKEVVVKNEDMAASLAVLSKMLTESFLQYGND